MSVSRFGSHPHTPYCSMEQVRVLELENQQLKEQVTSLQAQLDACRSSTPAPFVLPLQARRTVDFGSTGSLTTVSSPSRSVTPVTKSERTSSTKRQTQSSSTSSSVVLSSANLLELSTPVPGPDDKGGRGRLVTSMRDIFQTGKGGQGDMGPLQKACHKLYQCMALTLGPFILGDLLKVNDCGSAASAVSAGGPHCWAAKAQLKKQCEHCLSKLLVLEREWAHPKSS